jgi:crotonobetainyl-CoA:carnitine CoA-transferase CaiB-like acyl-CoA transferase
VLTTFRPSTAERYGISYRRLAEAKPDLIYVAIVGYGGEEYPRDHPSHDTNFAALTITAMVAKGEGATWKSP